MASGLAIACALTSALLTGSAAQLTERGAQVRVVTEQQRPSCKFVGMVTVQQSLGPDKPGNALKAALNKTAAAGGNGLYIITNTVHWADGASVAGEALSC